MYEIGALSSSPCPLTDSLEGHEGLPKFSEPQSSRLYNGTSNYFASLPCWL